MHTIIVIAIGFIVLVISVLIGRLTGGSSAAMAFLPIWLVGAGINLWIGVSKAGHSIKDEAPIFLIRGARRRGAHPVVETQVRQLRTHDTRFNTPPSHPSRVPRLERLACRHR